MLKRNREKKRGEGRRKRKRENAERKREGTKRGVIVQGEVGALQREEEGGRESRACNIASGNVAHYLVAALTICTMDHPQQYLSFELEGRERDT